MHELTLMLIRARLACTCSLCSVKMKTLVYWLTNVLLDRPVGKGTIKRSPCDPTWNKVLPHLDLHRSSSDRQQVPLWRGNRHTMKQRSTIHLSICRSLSDIYVMQVRHVQNTERGTNESVLAEEPIILRGGPEMCRAQSGEQNKWY